MNGNASDDFDVIGDDRDPLAPTPLSARLTRLRPLLPSDYDFLYSLSISEQLSFRWRYRGTQPSQEAFIQGLHQNILCQFVVTRPDNDEPLGHVVSYAADMRNGLAFIAVAMASNQMGSGAGVEAMALLVNYVFDTWPLRKVYFEASEFVYAQYASGEGTLFVREGTMRQHWYFAGRYWDEHLLAIYREHRDLHMKRFLGQ